MANTATRISANGTLFLSGNLDEVTYNTDTGTSGIKNLFYSSNVFSSGGYSRTITPNAIKAPDGSTTGVLFRESSDASPTYHGASLVYQGGKLLANVRYTFSIYVKNYSSDRKIIFGLGTGSFIVSGAYGYGLFDPVAGTASLFLSIAGNPTSSIQNVGDGWYRCILSITPTVTYPIPPTFAGFDIQLTNAANSNLYQGNGTSGIYVWGGQVEVGTSATVYQPILNGVLDSIRFAKRVESTGSVYIKKYFDEITYNTKSNVTPVNLLGYSQDLDNIYWGKYQGSITPNVAVAPDGTLTADKWVENTAGGVEHFYYRTSTFTNTTLTGSVYLKAAERTSVYVSISNFINATSQVWFNLTSGTIFFTSPNNFDFINTSGTITNVGNGWYRCTITTTKLAYNTAANFGVTLVNGGTSVYTGDGTSGLYAWGNQLELGSVATDYVQTSAAGVITTPKFVQRITSNGTHYVTGNYDELNKPYITQNLLLNIDPSIRPVSGTTLYDVTDSTKYFTLSTTELCDTTTNTDVIKFTRSNFPKYGGGARMLTTGPLAVNTFMYNDHTWEVWIRIDDTSASFADATETASVIAVFNGYHQGFTYWPTYASYVIWDGSTVSREVVVWPIGSTLLQGSWYQLVVTRSANTFTGYVNGAVNGFVNNSFTFSSSSLSSNALNLGNANGGLAPAGVGPYSFNSKNTFGGMRMYNRALTAAEVNINFQSSRNKFGI
jgi:hypothetical protein